MKKARKLSDILPNDKKFTLIIGSGLNSYSIDNNKSILTNWESLPQSVFPSLENHFDNNSVIINLISL